MKSRPLIRFHYICGLNPNLTLKSSLLQSASSPHSSNYLQLTGHLYDVENLFLLITRNGKYKYERCLDGFQSLTTLHLVTFSSLAVLPTSSSLLNQPQQETGSPIWPWSWSRFLHRRGLFLASVACWGSGLGFLYILTVTDIWIKVIKIWLDFLPLGLCKISVICISYFISWHMFEEIFGLW